MNANILIHFLILIGFTLPTKAEWYGTPPHNEIEYKKSYLLSANHNQQEIYTSVLNALEDKLSTLQLELPRIVDSKFQLLRTAECFAYADYYLDDRHQTLFKNQMAYRMRYRFKNLTHYRLHKWLPFLSFSYPLRFEIQVKTDYDFSGNFVQVKETRFEFRNDSYPFSVKKDAPPSPWPLDAYLKIATSGQFNGHKISPFAAIEQKNIPFAELNIVSHYVTNRCRAHINIKNPWGRLPNPDQVIIVSFDFINVPHTGKTLFELELELDRSFGEGVQENIDEILKGSFWHNQLKASLVNFSNKALQSAHQDFSLIVTLAYEILEQKMLGTAEQTPIPKHQRMKILNTNEKN